MQRWVNQDATQSSGHFTKTSFPLQTDHLYYRCCVIKNVFTPPLYAKLNLSKSNPDPNIHNELGEHKD